MADTELLRDTIARVLREHPQFYMLYKSGKSCLGPIVTLTLRATQGGFPPVEVQAMALEILATWQPPILRDKKDLALIAAPTDKGGLNLGETDKPTSPEGRLNVARWSETDLADRYRGEQGVSYQPQGETEEEQERGILSLPVLEFLNGRAWDNAALNVIRSLRPSSIRVTKGVITVDSCRWRVTVWLEGNDRTIKRVTQEVEVGLVGCRYGSDVADYIEGRKPVPQTWLGIVNPRGVQKPAR